LLVFPAIDTASLYGGLYRPSASQAVFVKSREKRSEQRFSQDKAFNRGFWVKSGFRILGESLARSAYLKAKARHNRGLFARESFARKKWVPLTHAFTGVSRIGPK
jgi:hypothetical protein